MTEAMCGVVAGGRQRADPGNTVNLKRAARLSRVLADLQYHGRQSVQRQVRPLRRRLGRPDIASDHRKQDDVRRNRSGVQLVVASSRYLIRQRAYRIPRALADRTYCRHFPSDL